MLPPRLFSNPIFVVANLTNLLTSVGMLGGIVFMPLFLQLVYRLEAANSGLMLIPLTATSVIAAITTGRLVAKTGRYRIFPILGVIVTGLGMAWLSTVTAATPLYFTASAMALGGFGIGLIMPVMMVCVQNAVETRDLGTATSSISFFRSMGGSFGVALFGAVLIARMNATVGMVPGHEVLGPDPAIQLLHGGTNAVAMVPEAIRQAIADAITYAFHDVFRVGTGIAVLTLISVLFLKEVPLRTTIDRAANPSRAHGGAAGAAGLAD